MRGADMKKNIAEYFTVFAANLAEMFKIKDLFERDSHFISFAKLLFEAVPSENIKAQSSS
jgi:hypothetical protein